MNDYLVLFLTDRSAKASLRLIFRFFWLEGYSDPTRAVSADEVNEHLGYDKRNLARDLAELVRSGILIRLKRPGERFGRYYLPKDVSYKINESTESQAALIKEKATILDTKH